MTVIGGRDLSNGYGGPFTLWEGNPSMKFAAIVGIASIIGAVLGMIGLFIYCWRKWND